MNSLQVPEENLPERLDKLLAKLCPHLSRSRAQQLIEQGQVQMDGTVITECAQRIKVGKTLCYTIPDAMPSVMQAAAIELDIIEENSDYLIINKPAGMTVHPGAGNHQDTLANALLYHCGDSLSGIGGVQRPGIVHRLDKDTTGLMIAAKHDQAHQHLAAQLSTRQLKRTYLALCWGVPKPLEGMMDAPIGRSPRNRQKMAVIAQGKPARTHYKVLRIFGKNLASLVQCQLETGRTHQIRVHFTHSGHPLIGDPAYGAARRRLLNIPETAVRAIKGFTRQALHAYKLGLEKPGENTYVTYECPIPKDMEALIKTLETLETS